MNTYINYQRTHSVFLKASILVLSFFFFSLFTELSSALADDPVPTSTSLEESAGEDFDYYQKYLLYLKYQKRVLYQKYLRYKKGKLGKKYRKYKKYKKYNKPAYDQYATYGTQEYLNGYNNYLGSLNQNAPANQLGEADLGNGTLGLGPDVKIGLWNYSKDELKSSPFKIDSDKSYVIKDKDGNLLATISGNADSTYVTYTGDGDLKISRSVSKDISTSKEINFEAANPQDTNMIFHVNHPDSDFDRYRGKITLKLNDDGDKYWVINTLPLEQYVWGMGEITGTGPADFNKVMTVSYRTYGYWKMKFSTKYAKDGFKVNATPGNQLYYGYDWEAKHQRIKDAAQATFGSIVMYKGEIAITPYSSWTDGKTRSFEDRWGSKDYPWCQSEKDPYGDYNKYNNPDRSTQWLVDHGNHMVGLSAHGALNLADDHNKSWDWILQYYFSKIDIKRVY